MGLLVVIINMVVTVRMARHSEKVSKENAGKAENISLKIGSTPKSVLDQ
jgi:hypothetical protein